MNLTLDTWIISDTHFNHDNIVKYCGRPSDHTEIMVEQWNALVAPDDTVLHLGDLFMGKTERSIKLLKNLPGNKFFVRGNHDKRNMHWYGEVGFHHVGNVQGNGWQILNAVRFIEPDEEQRVLFTHYPDLHWQDQWDINIHGHIHNNGYAPDTPLLDYRNVSVEVMDYRPWRLSDILYRGKYQARADAPIWTGQTRDESERTFAGGIVLPTPSEVGYFGEGVYDS